MSARNREEQARATAMSSNTSAITDESHNSTIKNF